MEPTLAAITLAIVAFGLVSGRAERSPLTPPLFFTAMGGLFGALGVVDVGSGNAGIHALAELTLMLVLFTDASRIDLAELRKESVLPVRLLTVGMPLTIVAGAVVAALLFDALSFVEAALLAAILTPTDAALGQAVVSNPSVPVRIRQSLNVESGLNDGIALPMVLVLASMAGAVQEGGGTAYWVRFAVLAVTLGPLVGIVVGGAGGRLLSRATRDGWVSEPFQRIASLALAVLAYAAAEMVGGNGFIASFVAGLTLGNVARDIGTVLHAFGEAEGQLFGLIVFVLFGAMLVPDALARLTPTAIGYAVLSLTVVRMLPVALSLIGSGLKSPSIAFLGWFGPRGLASILFVLLVVESGQLDSGALIESVVVLTVLCSIVLHGLTAYPLAARYGRWVRARHDTDAERVSVGEMPVRIPQRSLGS